MAALRLELRIVEWRNRRQKRRLMRDVAGRLHRDFNVSVAEEDPYDGTPVAVLGVAAVGPSRREARDLLERVVAAVAAHRRVELTGHAFFDL